MPEPISVEQALKRRNVIVRFIFLASLGIGISWSTYLSISARIETNPSVAILIGSWYTLYFLCRAIIDPKWRIWAFTNVRDMHALQHVAIERGFIPKDGSLTRKYELRTSSDTQKLRALEEQLNEKTKISGDQVIPSKTEIY